MSKKIPKVALYLRVSSERKKKDRKAHSSDRKPQNLENQLPPLEAIIKSRGWRRYDLYTDEMTATGRKEREGFDRMMKDASAGRFDVLLVWALDRFTREGAGKALEYLNRLSEAGVDFVSYEEQWLDTTGPWREVIIAMFATMAKLESKRISNRVKAGIERRKKLGLPVGRQMKEIRTESLAKMLSAGMTYDEMAEGLGVSRTTLARRVAAYRAAACIQTSES